jgi:hypothetical protein
MEQSKFIENLEQITTPSFLSSYNDVKDQFYCGPNFTCKTCTLENTISVHNPDDADFRRIFIETDDGKKYTYVTRLNDHIRAGLESCIENEICPVCYPWNPKLARYEKFLVYVFEEVK